MRAADPHGCTPSDFSPEALAAMDKQVNAVRELVGLDAVPVRADAAQQQSALMMEANDTISHTPPSSWRCFTQGGAGAAGRSNLAMGWPSQTAGSAVSQYLADSDAYNTFVGHRRWLFYPSTPAFLVGQTAQANVWQVMGGTPRPDATTPATIA